MLELTITGWWIIVAYLSIPNWFELQLVSQLASYLFSYFLLQSPTFLFQIQNFFLYLYIYNNIYIYIYIIYIIYIYIYIYIYNILYIIYIYYYIYIIIYYIIYIYIYIIYIYYIYIYIYIYIYYISRLTVVSREAKKEAACMRVFWPTRPLQ